VSQKESEQAKAPHDLIHHLWDTDEATVTLSLKDWRRVLLYYGTSLHFRNGEGHDLKATRIGPGVYSVRLVRHVYEFEKEAKR
jgi:hypothetical protein